MEEDKEEREEVKGVVVKGNLKCRRPRGHPRDALAFRERLDSLVAPDNLLVGPEDLVPPDNLLEERPEDLVPPDNLLEERPEALLAPRPGDSVVGRVLQNAWHVRLG